jgi:outer membrane protein assembly factor BamD (BamD/ComL family)
VKVAGLVLCLAALAHAPLQCASEPDPTLRRHETPGEALYGLAQKFHEQGNETAWRETLEYLIDRYPNSRFAARARQDLGEGGSDVGEEP